MTTPQLRSRSRGFSLIELMIAITIGLVITAAIGYMFYTSKQTFKASQGMARLQENGRTAQMLVDVAVRQAGYVDDPITYNNPSDVFTTAVPAISGGAPDQLSSDFSWISAAPSNAALKIKTLDEDGLAINNDYLEVAYMGDATANVMVDCLGTSVSNTEVSINVFYVDQKTTDSVPSLYCAAATMPVGGGTVTATGTPQPIVVGIRGLQVRYGIDSTGDGVIDYYATRDVVTDWTQVKSVTLRLTSQSNEIAGPSSATSTVNSSGTQTTIESYLTRPIINTIYIRNRLVKPS